MTLAAVVISSRPVSLIGAVYSKYCQRASNSLNSCADAVGVSTNGTNRISAITRTISILGRQGIKLNSATGSSQLLGTSSVNVDVNGPLTLGGINVNVVSQNVRGTSDFNVNMG